MSIRVADIQAEYEEWGARGADFITPPIDNRGIELRLPSRDLLSWSRRLL